MTLAPRIWVSALLAVGMASQASAMKVCLQDRSGLTGPARAGLVRELHALLPRLDLRLSCSAPAGSDVVVTVLPSRSGIPADALGLAYRVDGAILPRLEVFVDPVLQLTQTGDWETLGRALARVAVHELLHYLNQSGEHAAYGLLQERLTPTDLVSEELRPRLIASLHHD